MEKSEEFSFQFVTRGYFYFLFTFVYQRIIVTVSLSDYEEMVKVHESDHKQKLILYPNGDLCYDWDISKTIK